MIIAVDFDGTCVTHEYPNIGKDIGAIPVLKEFVEQGDKLILYTMRSGVELSEAVNWFHKNEIELFGVNINPTQASWTDSPKVFANVYIDDAALGCPLIYNPNFTNRPYVDWNEVKNLLTHYVK